MLKRATFRMESSLVDGPFCTELLSKNKTSQPENPTTCRSHAIVDKGVNADSGGAFNQIGLGSDHKITQQFFERWKELAKNPKVEYHCTHRCKNIDQKSL